MRLIRCIIPACFLALSLFLTQCKVGDPATYTPPPRHCDTADECFRIFTEARNTCQFPAPMRFNTQNFYRAYDFHTSRNIIAVVEIRVLHLQEDGTLLQFR
jgi:hypothetical protein